MGIRPEIDGLRIDPCIPRNWPGFSMKRVFRGATYDIEGSNPKQINCGVRDIRMDGKPVACNRPLPIAPAGSRVRVEVVLG